jgi:hypothetical protein
VRQSLQRRRLKRIKEEWAEPLQKVDVFGEEADKISGDEKRTDTPEALGAR